MQRLADLIVSGFGTEEGYNCAEKILCGSNIVYDLGLDPEVLRMSAGFGGGMGIGSACGASTAAVMVISLMFSRDSGSKDLRLKQLVDLFIEKFKASLKIDSIDCNEISPLYQGVRNVGCDEVIIKAAEVIDSIIDDNLKTS